MQFYLCSLRLVILPKSLEINNYYKYLIFHIVLTSYTSSKVGGGGSSPNENMLDSCGRGGIAGACLGMGGGGRPGGLVVSLETET